MAPILDRFLPAERASPIFDGSGDELPGWRDKGVWLLLAFVLVLELVAWQRSEGYPIADSVEFMERARMLVRGEPVVDSTQIRPMGFSLLLAPIFLLGDWIGLSDPRPVLWTICLAQIVCGLALVLVCVRLGARLGGRRAGLVAGFLVGTNPIFLTYSSTPVSGICAAVCIGLGLESLWERGNARREWIGALWLAASVLMIYQCALIVAALAGCIVLRDRKRAWRPLRTIGIALLLALALQFLLDRVVYGSFGASLGLYLLQKVGGLLAKICALLGLREWAFEIGTFVFDLQGNPLDPDVARNALSGPLRSKQPWGWYFEHLPQMLAWPVLLLFFSALWHWLRRPTWIVSIAWLVFGANLAVMTINPTKEFRLWLPLLPFVAPLCAYGGRFGWSALGGSVHSARENVFWRRTFTAAIAGSSMLLALIPFLRQERREYGGYWQAIDYVNELAQGSPRKLRVAVDYNWAVFQRESQRVELVKLPSQLSLWGTSSVTQKRKDELLAVLPGFDLFVLHQPVLSANPDLCTSVSSLYQVCAAFYDKVTYEKGLGPIYILSRRTGAPTDNIFFDVAPDSDSAGLGSVFAREDGSEELELLGIEYRTLPPEGLGWITYHWYSPTGLHTPWTLIDRVTAPDEAEAWQNNHAPAWGTLASEHWPARTRVSEGYLLVPAADTYDKSQPYRPLGGEDRRKDSIPMRLWMSIVHFDPCELAQNRAVVLEQLQPRRSSPKEPLTPEADGTFSSPDGTRWSADDMLHVGSFSVPVRPADRLPAAH